MWWVSLSEWVFACCFPSTSSQVWPADLWAVWAVLFVTGVRLAMASWDRWTSLGNSMQVHLIFCQFCWQWCVWNMFNQHMPLAFWSTALLWSSPQAIWSRLPEGFLAAVLRDDEAQAVVSWQVMCFRHLEPGRCANVRSATSSRSTKSKPDHIEPLQSLLTTYNPSWGYLATVHAQRACGQPVPGYEGAWEGGPHDPFPVLNMILQQTSWAARERL